MGLFPYQEAGVEHLLRHPRAYLADEMGLGKTVQVLAAIARARFQRLVVVCPASVRTVWEAEAETWAPGVALQTLSYAQASRGALPEMHGDVLVLDEAHYIKNPKSKRTKALVKASEGFERVWLLSGTPMPNDARELYVPAVLLARDRIPARARSYWGWTQHFTRGFRGEYGYRVTGSRNAKELVGIFGARFLRRTTRQVRLDLPPLRVTQQRLDPPAEVAAKITEVVDGIDPKIVEALVRGEDPQGPAVETARLRRWLGELKAPLVAATVREELSAGLYGSIVIIAHHRSVIETLEEAFADTGRVVIHGGTPHRVREDAVRRFQAGEVPVFIGQITSAGTGLTLTRASELVLLEPDWSPANNTQAIKRIHRVSQTEPCRARIFTCAGTMDEAIMGTLHRKLSMIKEAGLT